MADRVQQVGLAAPGAAVDEERIEADRLRRRERPRGGRCDFVGLADDERFEPIARIEIGRVGIALGRRRRFLEDQQRRGPRRIGGGDHPDIANDRQDRLPRQRQPLAEMRANPVGHELARHDDVERAAVGLERAELGGLQPAVEGTSAKVAAKAGANRFPGRFERRGDCAPSASSTDEFAPPPCTGSRLPRSNPQTQDKRIPSRANRVARPRSLFSLAPGADSRPERPVLRLSRRSFQVPFFHESEIKRT